jgi:outer membrane protein OmpA-like peptidoglycan-associated protein
MDEINKLLANAKKQNMQIRTVIVAGYVDRIEASSGMSALSEERAKSVLEYLTSNGIDPKLVFWEGRGARDPVPVTKFCN